MAKITCLIDLKNKYRNALYFGNLRLIGGNHGLEAANVDLSGKRAVLHLQITNFDLVICNDQSCPDRFHYDEISAAVGSAEKLAGLGVQCEMLRMSATACDGCPKRNNK